MTRIDWASRFGAIMLVAAGIAAAAAALPGDPYQRFATLDNTIQNRIRWVYERTHFDPTPIDVVVIGSSRTGAAVAAPQLEAGLRAAGRAVHVVNFSLPEAGRDLNWVLLQQVLATKHPRLFVIGVTEKPSRFGHPAFKYVASTADIVDPAYVGNLNYLTNLAYLPFRGLRLFAARVLPGHLGLPVAFAPARYAGTSDDTTKSFRAGDGTLVERNRTVSPAALAAGVVRYERGVRPPLLGRRWADVEFGDDRAYLARMAALAHSRGVRIVFLFLPYYTGPSAIQERSFYERFGPVLDATFVSRRSDWYSDAAHLNHTGALVVTEWLTERLAPLLAPAESAAAPMRSDGGPGQQLPRAIALPASAPPPAPTIVPSPLS